MKSVILTAVAGVIVLGLLILVISREPPALYPVLDQDQAVKLVKGAGGADGVNIEAIRVFAKFGEKEMKSLSLEELKDYPGISALGKVLGIWPETFGFPTHIRIRRGDHRHTQFIYILSTNGNTTFDGASNCIQISPTIYVSNTNGWAK